VEREKARAALGVEAGERIALFIGFVRPYKGVDVVLEAFHQLPASVPWRFLVAGEAWGSTGDELVAQAHRLGLGSRVELRLGWVPEDEMHRLLAAADLVVLPYRGASQSAVAPLALAHGVPVLASEVGGLPEVVVDGRTGRLVPPGDPEAIADVLRQLDDPALRALRSNVASDRGRLSWSAYVERLEELIERVV
jgi:glycosyltransferase involved in cell wall biosynthesis